MLFGKKKKTNTVEPVEKPEFKCSERKCVHCGATCVRGDSGNFKCKFCGAVFTDEDAEMLAAARRSERERCCTDIKESVARSASGTSVKQDSPRAPERVEPRVTVSQEANAEDIYASNCNGVLEIITDCGRASGFIISKNGFVITNAHAVLDRNGKPSDNIYVRLNGQVIKTKLIAIGNTDSNDANNVDLALLKMERVPTDAQSLRLGRSANVRIGQHIYYIGNSKGEGLCMTAGIISDNNRKVGERYFIMTDAATNPGNSGGPLFNDEGAVIGVHVSARVEADGMKYAIPVDTLCLFLNTVEDKLGVARDTIADNPYRANALSNESVSAGVILTLVLSGITLLVKNIEFIKEITDTVRA